jgi:hypothetical protein
VATSCYGLDQHDCCVTPLAFEISQQISVFWILTQSGLRLYLLTQSGLRLYILTQSGLRQCILTQSGLRLYIPRKFCCTATSLQTVMTPKTSVACSTPAFCGSNACVKHHMVTGCAATLFRCCSRQWSVVRCMGLRTCQLLGVWA